MIVNEYFIIAKIESKREKIGQKFLKSGMNFDFPLYEQKNVLYNRQDKGGGAMKCMRCGVGIEPNQVFCERCLQDAEANPVKQGTPILLPNQEEKVIAKRSVFRPLSSKPDDMIFKLKYIIFWLIIVIIILAVALGICIGMLMHRLPQWLSDLLATAQIVS